MLFQSQGTEVKRPVTFETGYETESGIIFGTLKYKPILDRMDKKKFVDNYASYEVIRNQPSMIGTSFIMGICAMVLGYALGLPIGVLMARKKDKLADKLGMVYIIFIIAVPSLAYIYIFRYLGTTIFNLPSVFTTYGPGDIRSWMLPIISLALPSISGLMLWTRRYVVDQMNSDYVKFAKSKGLNQREIFNNHIFKNAIIPIAQGIPASLAGCITGAIITESIYSVGGMGKMLPNAIKQYNNVMIVALAFMFSSVSVLSVLAGDIVLTKVDRMATEWSANEDASEWTFVIRDDAVWSTSSGEEYDAVVAEDFVTGLKHAADSKSETLGLVADLIVGLRAYSEGTGAWEDVGVKADGNVLTYTLTGPCGYFDGMTTYSILWPINAEFLESKGSDFGAVQPDSILYNGGYILSSLVPAQEVRFDANPNYYDAENVHVQHVVVTYTDGQDPAQNFNMFVNGEVNATTINSSLPDVVAKADELYKDNQYKSMTTATSFWGAFNWDRRMYNLYNDPSVSTTLKIEKGKRVSFRFADEQIRFWLRDQGSVLEVYTWKACRDTELFHDVRCSTIVEWDSAENRDKVTNEIDVMAVKDTIPVFISCKTCAVDTVAINELAILRDRYGGSAAKAIIISTENCRAITLRRANALNIDIITLNDLRSGLLREQIRALN